jgi:phosphoribosyl 1,2-cyclic phosphodiesterase
VRVTFWGTRGSIASAGSATQGYGGNTACAQVVGRDGTCIILDAGTGIRELGDVMPPDLERVDILLSHLHMDHIQGLGFFGPMFRPGLAVHIWGPPSSTLDLRAQLSRYLSPPLFPVRLRDLTSQVEFHNAPEEPTRIGAFEVTSAAVVHPGPTVGYRVAEAGVSMAYMPDHEPALGSLPFPDGRAWTSGHDLAAGVDLLVHDAQYFPDERRDRIGWGHSSSSETGRFAQLVGATRLACFHHDPSHDDATIDRLVDETARIAVGVEVSGAREGQTISLEVGP